MKKRILPFLDEYSNVLIAICALLTTVATFFIWRVSVQQVELAADIAKAAEQPIIKIDYIFETLREFNLRNNYDNDVVGTNSEIRTVRLTNIGRGAACNLRIDQGKQEIGKGKRLAPGEKTETFVFMDMVRAGKASLTAKVTYQDVYKNEYTTDDFCHTEP